MIRKDPRHGRPGPKMVSNGITNNGLKLYISCHVPAAIDCEWV